MSKKFLRIISSIALGLSVLGLSTATIKPQTALASSYDSSNHYRNDNIIQFQNAYVAKVNPFLLPDGPAIDYVIAQVRVDKNLYEKYGVSIYFYSSLSEDILSSWYRPAISNRSNPITDNNEYGFATAYYEENTGKVMVTMYINKWQIDICKSDKFVINTRASDNEEVWADNNGYGYSF